MTRMQKSPGPAAYNIKSTVCIESPSFSFGTMKRPSPNFKGISPGPIYMLKTTVGRNKDFTVRSGPSFGFGTSDRPDPSGMKGPRRAPGPGEYDLGSVVGPQKPPAYKSAPSFGFGTSSRLPGDAPVAKRLDRSAMDSLNGTTTSMNLLEKPEMNTSKDQEIITTPGPGEYDNFSWKNKRPPAFSFGTSAQRAGPSMSASKIPGPGQYKLGQTTGPRTSLTLRRGPSISFGASRPKANVYANSEYPGPGAYPIPSSVGVQPTTDHRSLPSFSFGTSQRRPLDE
mmetsp:Transcript_2784/g.6664  ORF Transcript_2784/g.6664 Transcript_2784/m.6664 type:complete len:283 (-) Transcript_2784:192-1040(-)